MLYLTDIQKQFEANEMTRLSRGEKVELAAAYQEPYNKWLEKERVQKNITKWSTHDQMENFMLDLEGQIDEKIMAWIAQQDTSDENKRRLKHLAKRGELILVSDDEGKSFNKVLVLSEVDPKKEFSFLIQSSTLRTSFSTHIGLRELHKEEKKLRLARHLEAAGYEVKTITIENGEAKAEVLRVQDQSTFTVTVDLKKDAAQPLVYDFLDAQGNHEQVAENVLGDTVKRNKTKVDLREDERKPLMAATEIQNQKGAMAAADAALAAEMAEILQKEKQKEEEALNAMQGMSKLMPQNKEFDFNELKLVNPNVTASKVALRTRIQREQKANDDRAGRIKQRIAFAKDQSKQKARERQLAAQQGSSDQKQSSSPGTNWLGGAIAAGASALTAGAAGAISISTLLTTGIL